MRLSIISFTKEGILLSQKLSYGLEEVWKGERIGIYTKCSHGIYENAPETDAGQGLLPIYVEESIGEWTRKQMEDKKALLFVGACGIAVRAIAPCVVDKLHDSPVLVIDEAGRYIIPILSGHMGGANELAGKIAETVGAEPVITTATDIRKKFAVDLFAKKNGLLIMNKEGIAKVSSKVLAGQEVTVAIEPGHLSQEGILPEPGLTQGCRKLPQGLRMTTYPPKEFVDLMITSENRSFDAAITLRPKEYVIGMGCRRGKEPAQIEAFIQRQLEQLGITKEQVFCIASIDKKKDEEGLLTWSRRSNVPFVTFSARELQAVEGIFQTSAFVQAQVGVDNVCERAALKVCEGKGKLILTKQAEDGMTMAVARREWSVTFDEE